MTIQEFENKLRAVNPTNTGEENAQDLLLDWAVDHNRNPNSTSWENAAELLATAYDEEHEGAFTEEEITHPFDDKDIDAVLALARIKKPF